MQLNELQTFLAIVETGSLVRASERLNVTQSTVTARLKSLEAEIGQTLINRQKSGATLTAAGVRLQRYANTISDLWRQARQETALPDGLSSVVNLGCHPNLWTLTGDTLFDYVRTTTPAAALSVSQGYQLDLNTWLNDGLVDLCLSYWPATAQHQGSVALFEDRLILVATSPDSPIKFDPDYIFVEAGEAFGRQHAATYSDAGVARVSFNSAQIGMDYLLKTGGSAYLPERLVRDALAHKTLFELTEGPVFTRTAYLSYNRSARNTWHWFDDAVEHMVSASEPTTSSSSVKATTGY